MKSIKCKIFIPFLVIGAVIFFGILYFGILYYGIIFYKIHHYEAKRPQIGSPFAEGQIIISALEKYKKDKGIYPEQLSLLVPIYLKKIPSPNWGINQWDYVLTKEGKSYALSVRLKKNDYICHIYENGQWCYDQ